MRLSWRVERLERETNPPATGCPGCTNKYLWGIPDDRIDDPTWKPVCEVCGQRPARAGDCAECGGPPTPPVEYRLEFEHGPRTDEPERCPACNRRLVFRLEFDRQG